MTRALIIPAAGLGTRLGVEVPKVLAPVAGRPMLVHLLEQYARFVASVTVVVAPSWTAPVLDVLAAHAVAGDVAIQATPTGMLDAVLAALPLVSARRPDRVWITWCDQLAVRDVTLARLAREESAQPEPALVMPTHTGDEPYIHFARGADGRIVRVLHRREGDGMPERGESDIGVFSLSGRAYQDDLGRYGAEAERGARTGERNFLPFIPWLARTGSVVTFPCLEAIEALGINTPDDLARVEAHLLARAGGRSS